LHLALEESALKNDEITEIEDIQFLVNERDKVYFDNIKVDYTESPFGGGQFTLLRV
jgi:Fe-S cluster assembly iron-binding protein IscA